MGEHLAYRDAYQRAVEARVVGTDGARGGFYGARKASDEVWHLLDEGAEPPPVGATVTAHLDWERRQYAQEKVMARRCT